MTIREKRIAVVTGANKGIGCEVARDLARKGFHVFLGARDEKAGRAAEEKLRKDGEVTFLKIDIANLDSSIKRAAQEFSRQPDHLATLVNTAGILLDANQAVLTITPQISDTPPPPNTPAPLP